MIDDDFIPDINSLGEIIEAIAGLDVLGGYARGMGDDGKPDRYIERLDEYVARSEIDAAVRSWFPEYGE